MNEKNKNRIIVILESFWANSQLAFVRHTGRVCFKGYEYIIVDKRGHDIFECSFEAYKAGRDNAIEPGEPADLCRMDFVPIYRQLGREKFLRFLEENTDINTIRAARERLKIWKQKKDN